MKGLKFDDKLIPASSDHHEFSILPNGPNPSNLIQSCGMSLELDSSGLSSELDSPQDVILQYISEILMEEEDLEREPFMLQKTLALQAAEKSFYDVLRQDYPPSPNNQLPSSVLDQNAESPNASFTETCCGNSSSSVQNLIEAYRYCDPDSENFESALIQQSSDFDSLLQSFGSASNSFSDAVEDGPLAFLVTPLLQVPEDSCSDSQFVSQFLQYDGHSDHGDEPIEQTLKVMIEDERNGMINHSPNKGLRRMKNHRQENSSDYVEGGRSNKQLASSAEDSDLESEMYDEVLLPCLQESVLCYDNDTLHDGATGKARRRPRGKRQSGKVIDLMSLLTQSAQAIASSEFSTATELLERIRQHSSPYGNDTERLAHFFANALEARLAGSGTMLFSPFVSDGVTAADHLKCYQVYIQACPFRVLSNVYANRLILKLSRKAMRLHIVHFGILYGFQWPCLIQHLSARPGGPPLLRITGIELPQPGFRPAERVEETGRRLAKYCMRFNVPFKYHAIAKEWHTIQSEDLKINKDELLVVNSLYRFINVADDVPDESVGVMSSPRDTVLNLIRRINPDLFIHGVLNGTFGASFFVTRFREALLHYSALFNMYEDTVPREADERMLMEREIWGRDIMNVIACEGTQRVERPETYRQWQARNVKAGFSQLPLDREAVEEVRAKVKIGYDKEFVVDKDSNWMLQGWKGRIIYAISCWKPAEEFE